MSTAHASMTKAVNEAVENALRLELIALQAARLNGVAKHVYQNPSEALRRLTDELPDDELDKSLRWLWHAVFFQAVTAIRDRTVEKPWTWRDRIAEAWREFRNRDA